MTRIRVAIVERPGTSPVVEEVDLLPLARPDVLVRIEASGVCHTDVAYSAGDLWQMFPVVLGHEFAGTVESVGDDVTKVAPGDRVVVVNPSCGQCRFCQSGHPVLCVDRNKIPQRLARASQALPSSNGGFAEAAVSIEAGCIPIPDDVPFEIAAVAGCSVTTGVGAVFNVAKVQPGARVAVLGCGGVGASTIMAAGAAGAERIVVIDPNPERREFGLSVGATDSVAPDEEAIREIEPDGFDDVFEAAGRSEAMELAVRITRRGGAATIMGAQALQTRFAVDALDFVVGQRRILACLAGDIRASVDFDRIFRLYRRGVLDLGRLVSARLPLHQIAEAFERSRTEQGLRTLLTPSMA